MVTAEGYCVQPGVTAELCSVPMLAHCSVWFPEIVIKFVEIEINTVVTKNRCCVCVIALFLVPLWLVCCCLKMEPFRTYFLIHG